MILVWIILIPLLAGLAALLFQRNDSHPRKIALAALSLDLILALFLLTRESVFSTGAGKWYSVFKAAWLPGFGVYFHLAADGLSLLMILLTSLLGIMGVLSAWTEIKDRVGFFHFNLLWCLAGIMAVFLAMDLFLFYFFWELMLVPMFFLIAIWGHENRRHAAIKFFIFTQLSGLLMLISILGTYFEHAYRTGIYTFDYFELMGTIAGGTAGAFLFSGFLIAFFVKLPAIPFHTWLADAHTEAPTAGSIILAGLLLKTGAYGLIRFAVPIFPNVSIYFSEIAMTLAVVGIIYGAVLSFAQTDLKRLVAYSSVSHMGFVLLGIFAWNEMALQGAVLQMICHGISTGALFLIVGSLQERLQTRDMARMGGLWSTAPRMGGAMLLFALASLGLPGLGNFIGEFLVLLGAYRVSTPLTLAAVLGLIFSTIYAVRMIRCTFFGENRYDWKIPDFNARELTAVAVLIVIILWIGIYPRPFIKTAGQGINNLTAARPFATPSLPSIPVEANHARF